MSPVVRWSREKKWHTLLTSDTRPNMLKLLINASIDPTAGIDFVESDDSGEEQRVLD